MVDARLLGRQKKNDPTRAASTDGHKVLGSGYEKKIAGLENEVAELKKKLKRRAAALVKYDEAWKGAEKDVERLRRERDEARAEHGESIEDADRWSDELDKAETELKNAEVRRKRLMKLLAEVPTTQLRTRRTFGRGEARAAVYCLGCDRLVDECRDSDDTDCWAGNIVRELSFGGQ